MVFAVATNNPKKLEEMNRILSRFGHEGKSLKQLGISADIEENGSTFEENAIIKAKFIARMTGLVTVSDDSGLEVDRLGGAPGVFTARYAGENATDDENISKLLSALKSVPDPERSARFVSAVCLYDPEDDSCETFVGRCEGRIGHEKLGYDGFGYDPVFMVGDRSFAQMTSEEKDRISHRGRAMRLLEAFLENGGLIKD